MKKKLCVIVVLIASFAMVSCKGPDAYSRFPMLHVGTWTGLDSANTKGVVTFRENGTGKMEYSGHTYEFRYVFDYAKRPVWLDLLYMREGKLFRARMIVKFVDENHIKWYTFFNEVRPASFPEVGKGNVMSLTRANSLVKA